MLTVFGAIGQTVNVPLLVVGAPLQKHGQGQSWYKMGDRNVLGLQYCSSLATIKTARVKYLSYCVIYFHKLYPSSRIRFSV